MNKRKLKIIEEYIKKYRNKKNQDLLLDKILWFINCNLFQLKNWENELLGDKE